MVAKTRNFTARHSLRTDPVYRHIHIYEKSPMYVLNLRAVGNSTGATIPKELLAKLRVGAGDTVYATEAPDGGFRLTPYNPEFAAQMELAEGIMREDHDVLRALAK